MGLLRLYTDTTERKLVKSQYSTAGYGLPAVIQGETLSLELMFLTPNVAAGINSPYSILNISAYSLRVGIGTQGGTPATQQSTWSTAPDGSYFFGVLPMNTAGIATLLGSNTQVSTTFEIELSLAGSPDKPILIPITVKKPVLPLGSPDPTPGVTYVTTEQATATYARLYGLPGQMHTFISENGLWGRTIGVDNEGNPIDESFSITP